MRKSAIGTANQEESADAEGHRWVWASIHPVGRNEEAVGLGDLDSSRLWCRLFWAAAFTAEKGDD